MYPSLRQILSDPPIETFRLVSILNQSGMNMHEPAEL